ncbi:MAG: SDR family oxidoreductase [SAR202 cluster bacterium]|nr:SDR family oxidoreductase [SAR202 cluster bacterium]
MPDKQKMKGMVAIVTGASRGIGRAIAIEYGRQGAVVVAASRAASPTGLPGTAEQTAYQIASLGGKALAVHCDVTDEKQVKSMVDEVMAKYGKIDVLVNNAGLIIVGDKFLDIEPARWDKLMAINIRGPYLCCRYVAQVMVKQKRGSIINVGSRMGADPTTGGGTAYSASKAALHMLSFTLAEELREHNVAVNIYSPGSVKTEGAWLNEWNHKNWDSRYEPEASGPCAVYLALQSAESLTGRYLHRDDFGKKWGPAELIQKPA